MGDATETEPARKPGRPSNAERAARAALAAEAGDDDVEKVTATVTYIPLDAGDPHTTVAHGITFKANVPKEIPLDHHVKVENSGHRNNVVELLRGNPWFEVDGKAHPRRAPTAEPVPIAGRDVAPEALDDKKMVDGLDDYS